MRICLATTVSLGLRVVLAFAVVAAAGFVALPEAHAVCAGPTPCEPAERAPGACGGRAALHLRESGEAERGRARTDAPRTGRPDRPPLSEEGAALRTGEAADRPLVLWRPLRI